MINNVNIGLNPVTLILSSIELALKIKELMHQSLLRFSCQCLFEYLHIPEKINNGKESKAI